MPKEYLIKLTYDLGQEECVRLLIAACHNKFQLDRKGRSAHHLAAMHGQVIVLGALLGRVRLFRFGSDKVRNKQGILGLEISPGNFL